MTGDVTINNHRLVIVIYLKYFLISTSTVAQVQSLETRGSGFDPRQLQHDNSLLTDQVTADLARFANAISRLLRSILDNSTVAHW